MTVTKRNTRLVCVCACCHVYVSRRETGREGEDRDERERVC